MLSAINQMHATLGKLTSIQAGTYFMHMNNNAFERLPQVKITAQGKNIVLFLFCFLADSGATHSVIQHLFIPDLRLSGRSIYSIGASGQPVKENFSVPLSTSLMNDSAFKESFLWSQHCPINLLSHNLLLRMDLSLVPGPDGLKVVRSDTGAT